MQTDPHSTVRAQLASQEQLLWTGQPRQGIVLRGMDVFLIPFSLLWGGFAFFWEGAVIVSGAPAFFTLWGVPFVLVGLYTILGRFFVDARQRQRTSYGVTNERVVLVTDFFGKRVKSLSLRTLTDVSMDQKSDGSGSISFGPTLPFGGLNNGSFFLGFNRSTIAPTFDQIPNVRRVYDIIRDAQREAMSHSAG